MGNWNLDDIDWESFDKGKVDNNLLKVVRAASMVEYRSADYVAYLNNIFSDDRIFLSDVDKWGIEEKLHGQALAKWVSLADPSFDFFDSYNKFKANYNIDLNKKISIRGSKTGELLSRCVVEIGTSSFYSAISDYSEEPVLKQICKLIARDEFAHYSLFKRYMINYQRADKLNFIKKFYIAIGRAFEVSDDELSYAFYAGNSIEGNYNRKIANKAYASCALPLYKDYHLEKGIRMFLKALGFSRVSYVSEKLSKLMVFVLKLKGNQLKQKII